MTVAELLVDWRRTSIFALANDEFAIQAAKAPAKDNDLRCGCVGKRAKDRQGGAPFRRAARCGGRGQRDTPPPAPRSVVRPDRGFRANRAGLTGVAHESDRAHEGRILLAGPRHKNPGGGELSGMVLCMARAPAVFFLLLDAQDQRAHPFLAGEALGNRRDADALLAR